MIATSQAATDTIDYVVSDEFGNITTTTRQFLVQAASSTIQ